MQIVLWHCITLHQGWIYFIKYMWENCLLLCQPRKWHYKSIHFHVISGQKFSQELKEGLQQQLLSTSSYPVHIFSPGCNMKTWVIYLSVLFLPSFSEMGSWNNASTDVEWLVWKYTCVLTLMVGALSHFDCQEWSFWLCYNVIKKKNTVQIWSMDYAL